MDRLLSLGMDGLFFVWGRVREYCFYNIVISKVNLLFLRGTVGAQDFSFFLNKRLFKNCYASIRESLSFWELMFCRNCAALNPLVGISRKTKGISQNSGTISQKTSSINRKNTSIYRESIYCHRRSVNHTKNETKTLLKT